MTLNYACERFASSAEFFASDLSCAYTSPTDDALAAAVLDVASDMLYMATGGRVHGRCTATVRPMRCAPCGVRRHWWDYANPDRGIELRSPVLSVNTVTIDDDVIDPTTYVLIDGVRLLRKSGSWPNSNDLDLDDGETGTWSINYTFGREPDWITKQATIALAVNLALDASGLVNSLPAGAKSVNLQGVSISLEERSEALRNSTIAQLNQFFSVYAPDGRYVNTVWSPDLYDGWELVVRG